MSGRLRFLILSQKQAAHFLTYPRLDMTTPQTEDYFVEEDYRLPGRLVSNGAQPLVLGPSHTLSEKRDMVKCPGPLPRECISSEERTGSVRGRQRKLSLMAQLRMVLVWNMILGRLHSTFNYQLVMYLWQVCLCYPWLWQWGGHHHWRKSNSEDSVCLQRGWLAKRLDIIKSGETQPCLWQLCERRKKGNKTCCVISYMLVGWIQFPVYIGHWGKWFLDSTLVSWQYRDLQWQCLEDFGCKTTCSNE